MRSGWAQINPTIRHEPSIKVHVSRTVASSCSSNAHHPIITRIHPLPTAACQHYAIRITPIHHHQPTTPTPPSACHPSIRNPTSSIRDTSSSNSIITRIK